MDERFDLPIPQEVDFLWNTIVILWVDFLYCSVINNDCEMLIRTFHSFVNNIIDCSLNVYLTVITFGTNPTICSSIDMIYAYYTSF